MPFAQAVKHELRAAYGPQWIASAVQFIVIAGCLALVGSILFSTFDIAEGLSQTLENLK
jgi:hypothetical protein